MRCINCIGMWLLFLAIVQAQRLPLNLQRSWLYATPWRPLLIAPQSTNTTGLDTQQLSLGYTGPQIFPQQTQDRDQLPARSIRRPILLRVVAATQAPFTLPFRPSPFAGFSYDKAEASQRGQEQQRQSFELPFFAPGYPQTGQSSVKAVPEDQPQQQPKHFLYLSTGNMYNLVRS